MKKFAWVGAWLLGQFAFVACVEHAPDGTDRTDDRTEGGAVAGGGTTSTGRTPAPSDGGAASSCTQSEHLTIEEYCPTCTLDEDWTCDFEPYFGWVYEGCGYLYFQREGDVGDYWDEVYDSESGKLVYYYSSGVTDIDHDYPCDPSTTAGVMPKCDWTPLCGALGGMGGVGGAPD